MAAGVEVQQRDAVIDVWLDSGDGNLLSMPDCERLIALLADPPEGVHVLRLAARGPSFCLGRERAAADVAGLRAEATTLVRLNKALSAGPLVTLAEVAGPAAGYGVGLASLCHLTIAATNATFSFPEAEIGLAPTVVLSWLPRLIGWKQAFRLTATAEAITADEALQLGLLTAVTDQAQLRSTVDELIASLSSVSPRVHREIAAYLTDSQCQDAELGNQLAVERLVTASLSLHHDDGRSR